MAETRTPNRASPVSRKTKTQPGRATTHERRRRVALAAVAGLACQFAFLVAFQGVLAEHYTRRAQNAVAARKPGDAAVWARRALDLNPHAGYAAYFLGASEAEAGRHAEAGESFRRALRTMGHRAQALRELAACEEKTGDRTVAAKHLAEALAIEPLPSGGPVAPRATLGRLLFGLGRWADGMAQFGVACADAPASRVPFDGLTVGYEHFGVMDAAAVSAFALLASPPQAARAGDHLLRLSADAAQKPRIVSMLKEIQLALPVSDPRRTVADSLLKNIAAGP